MKHIHFVIYRLKSIVIIYCCYFCLLIPSFFIICIYSKIEFIKSFDDVKIQRKIITFTKDGFDCTVFINKMINSGIMKMFIFFIIFIFVYSFLLGKCYAFVQMIVVDLVWELLIFFVIILFFFYLIIWWGISIASESKLDILKDDYFWHHNCFYYFFFICLVILFYYYSKYALILIWSDLLINMCFDVKLYITFDLLFIVRLFFQNLQKQTIIFKFKF
jgi:hypothetical protein